MLLVGFAVPVTASFVLGCAGTLAACLLRRLRSNYASHRLKDVGAWEVTSGAFLFGGLMTLPLLFVVPVPDMPSTVDYGYLLIARRGGDERHDLCLLFRPGRLDRRDAGDQRRIRRDRDRGPGRRAVSGRAAVARALVGAAIIILGCAVVLGLLPRRGAVRSGG